MARTWLEEIGERVPVEVNEYDSGTWWMFRGRECDISLEARPSYCDRGNFIAKLHPRGELALEIDGADGWPRYYFDLDRAALEIEAWLEKRGQLPEEVGR